MGDFFAYLLGFQIGTRAAGKAFSVGGVILRIFKILISFGAWATFVEQILVDIQFRGIGFKLLGVLILLTLIVSFCYCIYRIETKRVRCSHIFPKICFLIMALFWAWELYADEGKISAVFILFLFMSFTGMWLPKMILESVEKAGKKSALISEVERRINKYKAKKSQGGN